MGQGRIFFFFSFFWERCCLTFVTLWSLWKYYTSRYDNCYPDHTYIAFLARQCAVHVKTDVGHGFYVCRHHSTAIVTDMNNVCFFPWNKEIVKIPSNDLIIASYTPSIIKITRLCWAAWVLVLAWKFMSLKWGFRVEPQGSYTSSYTEMCLVSPWLRARILQSPGPLYIMMPYCGFWRRYSHRETIWSPPNASTDPTAWGFNAEVRGPWHTTLPWE